MREGQGYDMMMMMTMMMMMKMMMITLTQSGPKYKRKTELTLHGQHLPNPSLRNRCGLIIFTNPSVRAGYDTRSIFKRS